MAHTKMAHTKMAHTKMAHTMPQQNVHAFLCQDPDLDLSNVVFGMAYGRGCFLILQIFQLNIET